MIKGEGIYSLARSFRNAGAASVMMTLWQVEDRVTADLMDRFYQELAAGTERGAALRTAKLSYLDDADALYSHPAYWAGLVALGEGGPVYLHRPAWGGVWWLVGGLILLGTLGLGFFLRRSRRNQVASIQ